jgi:manganese oxidase
MSFGRASMLVAAMVLLLAAPRHLAAQETGEHGLPQVITHDNTAAAGRLQDGVLSLSLRTGVGRWYPEGEASRALRVEAFGEAATPLVIPSPLIRVPAGTIVHATIHNSLSSPLRVHGLCERPGPCEAVTVAAGARHELRFALREPGTFHYWAATVSPALDLRDGSDSQLGGAIVVDAPGQPVHDRVFVLGLIHDEAAGPQTELTVINGRSWPFTERLWHAVGDTLRWRMVNLTRVPASSIPRPAPPRQP